MRQSFTFHHRRVLWTQCSCGAGTSSNFLDVVTSGTVRTDGKDQHTGHNLYNVCIRNIVQEAHEAIHVELDLETREPQVHQVYTEEGETASKRTVSVQFYR